MSSVASYMKNTADKVFSRWIRLKVADYRGYVTCVTCGVTRHYQDNMNAGHYADRTHMNTRFDEQNVHVQCVRCNKWLSGNMASYAAFIAETYGYEMIAELDQRSRTIKQWKLPELKAKVKEWRAEIEKLSTVKG